MLAILIVLVGAVLLFQKRTRPGRADLQLGQHVFRQNCAVCHGANAEGKDLAPPLNRLGHAHHHPDWELQKFIADGKVGFGQMPAWKEKLSDREIRSVIVYVKTLWTEDEREFQQQVNRLRHNPP